MHHRALIAETASSACLAISGIGGLFGMMLQFVYPNASWPAWTAGAFAVAGVGGAIILARIASRLASDHTRSGPLATIRPADAAESRRAA